MRGIEPGHQSLHLAVVVGLTVHLEKEALCAHVCDERRNRLELAALTVDLKEIDTLAVVPLPRGRREVLCEEAHKGWSI